MELGSAVVLCYEKAEGRSRTPSLRKRDADATVAKIEPCTVPTQKLVRGDRQQALQYSRVPRQGKKFGFFPFIRGETQVVPRLRSLFLRKCCNEVIIVGQAVSAMTF
ncbi:MAG: hypothetical protein M3O33_09120 [Cyanobacteriota bacterium]|nr:hypothetical protein [Cyanobacteriota bacterium]